MGDVHIHYEESGRLSPLDDTLDDGAEENTSGGWELGITTFGGVNGGGGLVEGVD